VRRELAVVDRVLDGAALANLDRWAERRDLAAWWRRLAAGIEPGATVADLLAQADERGRGADARAFLLSVGLLLEQLLDEDDDMACPGCVECDG
jgi:hypothetical protein